MCRGIPATSPPSLRVALHLTSRLRTQWEVEGWLLSCAVLLGIQSKKAICPTPILLGFNFLRSTPNLVLKPTWKGWISLGVGRRAERWESSYTCDDLHLTHSSPIAARQSKQRSYVPLVQTMWVLLVFPPAAIDFHSSSSFSSSTLHVLYNAPTYWSCHTRVCAQKKFAMSFAQGCACVQREPASPKGKQAGSKTRKPHTKERARRPVGRLAAP